MLSLNTNNDDTHLSLLRAKWQLSQEIVSSGANERLSRKHRLMFRADDDTSLML